MAYTMEDIRKSQEIFYYLLEKHELREEDEQALYKAYTEEEEALTLSDKVLIINDGEIAQYGTPKEIIRQPADDFVENFILNQLEIKRTNIFHLFAECAATA